MILVRWSYCADSAVGLLLAGACMMTYDSSYSSKSEILWAWEVIYWIWMMDEPRAYPEVMLIRLTFLPSGERKSFAVDYVILWIDLKQWTYWLAIDDGTNERHTLFGKEYGTNFNVLRSGLRFFDWSRLWSTWLDSFFLPEPAPHWLESMFD